MPVEETEVEFGKQHFVIEAQTRLQLLVGQKLARGAPKLLGKRGEIFLVDAQARGHFVPAVLVDLIGALRQSSDEIQTFDAATAAFANPVLIEPDDNRRPMVFVRDPRRHDAEDSGMPATRRHHDRGVARHAKLARNLFLRRQENLFLDLLSLAILAIEKPGQLRRFGFARGKQKLQRFFRRAQSPGGIQSRAEPEPDVFGENRRLHSADLDQFLQTDPSRSRNLVRAALDKRAVFAPQRHNVRDGGERDQIES